METKERENVNLIERPFVKECNNFIEARYIVMGNNIETLFKTINNDASLRSVVDKCLEDFDFTTQFGIALSLNQAQQKDFIMPKENEEIVALSYSILQKIIAGEIDFESFMSKYFLFNGTLNDCFVNFGHYFILPFKNALLNLENQEKYSKRILTKEEKKVEIEEPHDEDNKSAKRMMQIVDYIEDIVDSDYKVKEIKREEIKFYLQAFKEAVKINNKVILLALANAIVLASEKIKSLKNETFKLQVICNQL